ncbi:MAG TPA: hypothetical protein VD970_06150, partial [Acetobacteraceae bacterium]|nr:hypothetical protein [Acetobacteraceae bacterium]
MALGWLSGQAPFPEEPPPPAGLVDDPTFYLPDLQNMRIGLAVSDTDQFRRVAEYTGQPVEQIGRVNGRIVRFVPEIGQYAYIEPRALTTTGADPSNNNVPPMTPLGQGVSDFFGDGMLGQAALGLAEPWRYFDEAEAIGSNTLGSAAAAVGPSMGDAASITGGLLALPAGPGASVLAAGAGGAGGDALRQMLDRAIAGEDLRGLDYWNMAAHGLLGAVGQGLGLTAGRAMGAFQRNGLPVTAAEQRLIASNPLWLDTARKLIDYAKGRGIYISPGEATGLRS